MTLGKLETPEAARLRQESLPPPPPATGWRREVKGFEAGIWLLFMCVFGMITTFSLLSFNLPTVRVDGNPALPYLLAGVGCLGRFGVTLLLGVRFASSLPARGRPEDAPE